MPAQLTVPTYFWTDHEDRQPCDPGQTIARVVRRGDRYTIIDGTPDQIEVLRSDAAFYADPDAMDNENLPRGLRASARATLRAISKAEG